MTFNGILLNIYKAVTEQEASTNRLSFKLYLALSEKAFELSFMHSPASSKRKPCNGPTTTLALQPPPYQTNQQPTLLTICACQDLYCTLRAYRQKKLRQPQPLSIKTKNSSNKQQSIFEPLRELLQLFNQQ